MTLSQTKSEWLVPAVLVGTVAGFVAATGYSQWRARAIDDAATQIADGTSPRIENLAAARDELSKLFAEATSYAVSSGPAAVEAHAAVLAARERFNASVRAYLRELDDPASISSAATLAEDIKVVSSRLDRVISESGASSLDGSKTALADLRKATVESSEKILGLIQVDAARSHQAATRIERLRARAGKWAFTLDALCALLTLAGAWAVAQVLKARRQALESHARLQQERVDELELFTSRVAHDVLNPLTVVGLALTTAAREDGVNERAKASLARGHATLKRATRVVEGFLEFARAGAHPAADARGDVAAVLCEVREDVQPLADRAGIVLSFPDGPLGSVQCTAGLLASVLNNLFWNAIKYMGEAPEKRINLNVTASPDRIRFEVADTGPGLPPGLGQRAFDAFVRGNANDEPGVGLGLATVKRIVEAHRGAVGVQSQVGHGCMFWFSLPRAEEHDSDAARQQWDEPAHPTRDAALLH